ncbi:MAG: VCBS repeat-containing protein, partial [Chitinophagaceae bacterium]|nr:VCBS repeat-containing protein [Chitinophagaceae bacterium]
KRLNDIDYVNYVSNDEVQKQIKTGTVDEKEMALINKFPEIKLQNKFFRNSGSMTFADAGEEINNNEPTFSNGAVYADLDNDGDLDIVVNNINDPVLVYENNSNDEKKKAYSKIKLRGPQSNINAIGAKVVVFANSGIRIYEKYPVHGFLSSMEIPLHIGIANTKVDSAFLIWPDNTFQKISFLGDPSHLTFTYQTGLPKFDYNVIKGRGSTDTTPMEDITHQTGLEFLHIENPFNEFDREPLIPHMVSREGPALAVGDANGDGLDDVFIGSSKREKSATFFQLPNGKFQRSIQPELDNDSTYEDVDACWVDVNNDHHTDLVVASGGNEYYGEDEHLMPRVYMNDGKDRFIRSKDAFQNLLLTASCVVPYDFNDDGFADLFIGGRCVPWEYGQIPQSYLLQNDRTGKFKDVTAQYSKEISKVGFVTDAVWYDLDNDGDKDLLLTLEWGGIVAFINNKGSFTKKVFTDKRGWWNFILPCDLNNDGHVDLIAGNLGWNSRLKANENEPVRLYYNDFDGNGKKEQILTYYLNNKEIPFANKDELQRQMPVIKKRFLYAADFAKASLTEIFTRDKLDKAKALSASYFANSVLMNDGHLNFTIQPLPWEAQLTPFKDAVVVNANKDALLDILLVGNFYDNNIQMGRNDADYGTLLINKGHGKFTCSTINGLTIK